MTFDQDIATLITGIISLAAPLTKDERGKTTYDTPKQYKAFTQYASKEFRTQTMESRVPRAMITVLPIEIILGVETRVVLPDITTSYQITLYDGSQPPITSVDRAVGEDTLEHLVIFT